MNLKMDMMKTSKEIIAIANGVANKGSEADLEAAEEIILSYLKTTLSRYASVVNAYHGRMDTSFGRF